MTPEQFVGFADSAKKALALSANASHACCAWRSSTRLIQRRSFPGQTSGKIVVHCIECGRTIIAPHDGADRMAERRITGMEIESALRSGALQTDQCAAGKWRYLARRNDVEVCFTFDVDDEGNMLIIVTVMRKG